jgi:hypothetical protein
VQATRIPIPPVIISIALLAGCGGSAAEKRATQPATQATTQSQPIAATAPPASSGVPLTRTQLIVQGDVICLRANTRRLAVLIEKRSDYEALMPALAAYERESSAAMGKLTPPASMARDWHEMVSGVEAIALVTGKRRTFAEASNEKLSHELDPTLNKGVREVTQTAKRDGFKQCAQFD